MILQHCTISTLVAATLAVAGPHPGNCSLNVPLRWTVNTTYVDGITPSAITGDGSSYGDGQAGVSAIINVCSGTNDAVLLLSSPRALAVWSGP